MNKEIVKHIITTAYNYILYNSSVCDTSQTILHIMRCLLLANCIIQNPKIQNALREKMGSHAFQCQCSREYGTIILSLKTQALTKGGAVGVFQ